MLDRVSTASGVSLLCDTALRDESGILVAFAGRSGGVSAPPYDSLDLAAHVGDDPAAVDENRGRLFEALDAEASRPRLVTAEQVHGDRVTRVDETDAGRGAYATGGPGPVAGTDALLTVAEDLPLMLFYADCVPVVLVASGPRRAVAVVHAGWRGALAALPGKAAVLLAREAGCETRDLVAYVGPHICPEHYQVGPDLVWRFSARFASIAVARDRLDLGAVVSESLSEVGLPLSSVVRADECTVERTDEWFSYRVAGTCGRHAAFAMIATRP